MNLLSASRRYFLERHSQGDLDVLAARRTGPATPKKSLKKSSPKIEVQAAEEVLEVYAAEQVLG
jgi:hypothetical protein